MTSVLVAPSLSCQVSAVGGWSCYVLMGMQVLGGYVMFLFQEGKMKKKGYVFKVAAVSFFSWGWVFFLF